MPVSIHVADKDEQPVIEHLMQLYLHDFFEFDTVEMQSNGQYHYPYLNFYWQDSNRLPFLIRKNGQLAGFALVRRETRALAGQPELNLAEYFILRRLRRLGVGREAAIQLWNLLPGSWTVKVLKSNPGGYRFWKKALSQYKKQGFAEATHQTLNRRWTTFTFSSIPG
jgi:predicted acetyltransferase